MLLTIQRSKLRTMVPHSRPTGRYPSQLWCGNTRKSAVVSEAVAAIAVSRTMAPIEL
jgi:hypothetical protein